MSVQFEEIDFSAFSIEQLQSLIERARREIERQQDDRLYDVKAQIESLASSVGMSVPDLMSLEPKRRRGAAKMAGERIVKYRNDANADETWSGRGKRPRWLQAAIESGRKLEEFAV